MIEHCKSERGYTSAGRILALVLASLTTVWARDYRSVNADVWKSEGVHYSGLSQRMNTHLHHLLLRLEEAPSREMGLPIRGEGCQGTLRSHLPRKGTPLT